MLHKKYCTCGHLIEFFNDNSRVQCFHCKKVYTINWKPLWVNEHAPYLIEV